MALNRAQAYLVHVDSQVLVFEENSCSAWVDGVLRLQLVHGIRCGRRLKLWGGKNQALSRTLEDLPLWA